MSWAASCRSRSAAWLRSSVPRHTRRPCIRALRYCNTTVRSASASSSCRTVISLNIGSHQHNPFPSFPLLALPEHQASVRARSPGRSATSAHTHHLATQNSIATGARAERRTGAGAQPAVLPKPGGRSSFVRRPAQLPLELRPRKLPRPAAGPRPKIWTKKCDFRTKAKARMAL